MEKTMKVSVIMLAYNIENYIEIAIKGVLSQKTDYPVELIIGEDRSTDRTYEICKRYQEKYPELITVIRHEKNLGYQRNYMETYKHCRGNTSPFATVTIIGLTDASYSVLPIFWTPTVSSQYVSTG